MFADAGRCVLWASALAVVAVAAASGSGAPHRALEHDRRAGHAGERVGAAVSHESVKAPAQGTAQKHICDSTNTGAGKRRMPRMLSALLFGFRRSDLTENFFLRRHW